MQYYSLCSTVFFCVVLYHTVKYYVVLYCTVLHRLYCVRGFGVCVDDGGFNQPRRARVIITVFYSVVQCPTVFYSVVQCPTVFCSVV